ncbi:hypothetical protein [Duganella vulcania]|uniref:Uncharacterized protein n=1 Tax=Duganella vulcania TaxID=2692166 RepID=A0A845GXC1_9BURK|nr:hypothetical protein [Duganella vulcania]MYM97972.1 hypothetical protein [Duganella vulcania]
MPIELQCLSGMRVSHVWFSDHSICYLELGVLEPGRVRPNGTVGNPRGEVTVFLGYDWLVKSFGYQKSRKYFHMHAADLNTLAEKIIDTTIQWASLSETGNELEISLSTGDMLESVSSDNETDWNICFN